MQLPIDIKALIDEATNINQARSTELSLSLYIDNAAPADVVAHLRSSFASAMPNVRMTVSYLDASFVPHADDDFAIIAAGVSNLVGPAAAAVRAAGVPAMVVSTSPVALELAASQQGHGIPEGDIVSPEVQDGAEEPWPLDEDAAASLDARMGAWIVSVCHEKRLAMAIAFPFMRRALAKDAVQATALQNAGIGLVPIIPGADLPIMTLNQAKMMLQIAAAYGQDMDKGRAKELAAVVGGAYLCRVVARELVEFVPVLGFVVKPGIAYGGTAAVGYAAIEYFEGGEDVAGVANVATRAIEAGNKLVSKVRDQGPIGLADVLEKAQGLKGYASKAQSAVSQYAPKVAAVVNDLVESVVSQSSAAEAR